MHSLGQWFSSELGLSPWFVGLFVLPFLAALSIFALRDLVLVMAFRIGHVTTGKSLEHFALLASKAPEVAEPTDDGQ